MATLHSRAQLCLTSIFFQQTSKGKRNCQSSKTSFEQKSNSPQILILSMLVRLKCCVFLFLPQYKQQQQQYKLRIADTQYNEKLDIQIFKVQKKKMGDTLIQCIKQVIIKIFLKSNTLPPFLLIAQQCFQFALYLLIIHNPLLINHIMSTSYNTISLMGFLLILLLLVRIVKGISAFKVFYPIFLNIIISQKYYQTQWLAYIYLALIALMLIADTISNIKLDFSPQSLTSENLNITKIIHLVIFLFGITYSSFQSVPVLFQLISGVLFISLATLKGASLMGNKNYKEILMRFYILIGFDHFIIFLNSEVPLPNYVRTFLPIAASQLLYELYSRKNSQKIDQLYSQQLYFELCFRISEYVNGKHFDPNIEQEINSFMNDEITPQMRDHEKKLVIYQKMSNLLARQQHFQNYLLLALLYTVYKHQLLKAKKTIQLAKKYTKYNLIEQILIYRAEEILFEQFTEKSKQIIFQHYQSLYECDQFRNLMLKSSIQHINFWEFTKKPEIITQDFRTISDKTVDYQRKINKNYEQIQMKCITISLLYVSYLFEVARDYKRARKILEKLSFNQDFQVNLQINEKIFIRIQLMDDLLKIQKIGHNVSSFLGYDRKQVQGQKIDMFLPEFYRKTHKVKVDSMLENQLQGIHLFNRKTIIKNKYNFYEECKIVLRLHYDFQGELRLQGYLQMKLNLKYIWTNFLIVNRNEQILECSEKFSQIYPSQSKLHKTSKFFSHKKEYSTIKYHNQRKYFPLMIFKMEEDCEGVYFVQINQDQSQKLLQIASEKIFTFMSSIKNGKVDLSFIKTYYQKMKTIASQIFSKQYIVILLSCLLLAIGLIVCQVLFFYTMKLKEQSQSAIVTNTSNIVLYMNSLNRLGLDMNYIDLGQLIGYSNNFTTFDLINQTLNLQVYAQSMRYLSVNNFTQPSFLPNVTYPKLGFEVVMEFLSNAYMIKQFEDNPFTQNLSLSRVRLITQILFSTILQQYRNNYVVQIKKFTFFDQIINQILGSVILVLFVGLYLLIVRIQLKIRVNEKEALSLPLAVKQQDLLIQSIKVFIRKITKEEINYKGERFDNKSKFKGYETSFAPDASVVSKDPMRSEVSMRQLSGRNLMEDTLNKTLFLQSQQTQMNQVKVQLPLHSIQIKLRKRNKVFLLVPLIFILAVITLLGINQIKNNVMMNIEQGNSTQNILTVLRLGTSFIRVINGFLNTLCKKMSNFTTSPSTYFSNFQTLPFIPAIIQFDQSQFPEFSTFTSQLLTFQTQPMCQYIKCDQRFVNDINIVYSATTIKWVQFMNMFINTTLALSYDNFKAQLTTPKMKYTIDLLFYCGMVINQFLDSIYITYVSCYKNYTVDLISSKTLFVSFSLSVTFVGLVFMFLFFRKIFINQNYLKDITSIVKTDNHTNEDINMGEENQNLQPQVSEVK